MTGPDRPSTRRVESGGSPAPIDLFDLFGRILWGFDSGDGSIGASSLADRAQFTAAVRILRDRVITLLGDDAVAIPAELAVDPDPRAPLDRMLWADRLSGESVDPSVQLPGPRLVVVLGAARSGTTWLHRLISAHPAVAGTALGETWLFPDVVPIWDGLHGRIAAAELVDAIRSFCDRLLATLRDRVRPAASHVCEKTPATVWRLPMMGALYPDAHYVHIVRDGRDAALSMARSSAGRDDLATAAQAWVDAVSEVGNNSGLVPHFRAVRYEALLADPIVVVRDLWEWIGLDPSSEALAFAEARIAERVTPLATVGEVGAGKWQLLSAADQATLTRIQAPLLEALGY